MSLGTSVNTFGPNRFKPCSTSYESFRQKNKQVISFEWAANTIYDIWKRILVHIRITYYAHVNSRRLTEANNNWMYTCSQWSPSRYSTNRKMAVLWDWSTWTWSLSSCFFVPRCEVRPIHIYPLFCCTTNRSTVQANCILSSSFNAPTWAYQAEAGRTRMWLSRRYFHPSVTLAQNHQGGQLWVPANPRNWVHFRSKGMRCDAWVSSNSGNMQQQLFTLSRDSPIYRDKGPGPGGISSCLSTIMASGSQIEYGNEDGLSGENWGQFNWTTTNITSVSPVFFEGQITIWYGHAHGTGKENTKSWYSTYFDKTCFQLNYVNP